MEINKITQEEIDFFIYKRLEQIKQERASFTENDERMLKIQLKGHFDKFFLAKSTSSIYVIKSKNMCSLVIMPK